MAQDGVVRRRDGILENALHPLDIDEIEAQGSLASGFHASMAVLVGQAHELLSLSELGPWKDAAEEQAHETADVELKTIHRRARRDIKKLKEKETRLDNRLAHTPTKVPASELTGKNYRATMRTERRNLVNAIKIATYNAERLLARRFFKHYKDPRDWLTFSRSILQLPGNNSKQIDRRDCR